MTVHQWTDNNGQRWVCDAYDHGPFCRQCRPAIPCARCDDNGVITVAVAGPDQFGNYDTEEVLCPDCSMGNAVSKMLAGLGRFAQEMRERDIHVGVGGNPARCVNCGQVWPCPGSTR